jgi:hypothetical protein
MKIKEGEKVSNGDGKFDQGRYVTIPETKMEMENLIKAGM